VIPDWRSIPGNSDAFDLLRRMVHTRQTVAFVGAGASAGLYPLWSGLIKELANRAVSRGASGASRQFWMKNVDKLPDVVVAGIKRALDQGSYAELLREIFRAAATTIARKTFQKLSGCCRAWAELAAARADGGGGHRPVRST
jgi:hypothetical protein